MRPTYSPQAVPRRPRMECHDCGASADIQIVADVQDPDGYKDDIALCRRCLEKREQGPHA